MIFRFARKNDLNLRQDILRGVYEENLVMLGRGRQVLPRRRYFPLRKILLSALVCLFGVLMHGQYMGSSFSPVELTANVNTPPPTVTAEGVSAKPTANMEVHPLPLPETGISLDSTVNTSELRAFVDSRGLPLSRAFGLKIRTIMIDPGHGGTDSGSIGKMGTKEKDMTLDIAKKLKAHLVERGGYRVFMTREDDSSVPLLERVALAREAKGDLFISIHLNDLPQKQMNIIETYYFGPSNDKKILRLADKENTGSEYGLSDFREIVEKLGKTMKLQESKEFAKSIQANLFLNSRMHTEDIQNYGVKRAPFVVLLGVDVPSVLVEVSCLSNREEERELNSESHRENIARYLAAGIFDYLNKGALTHEAKR